MLMKVKRRLHLSTLCCSIELKTIWYIASDGAINYNCSSEKWGNNHITAAGDGQKGEKKQA